jgi:hypothetical protein
MDELDNLKMNDKNNNFFTRNWWNNTIEILKKYITKKSNKSYKVYTAILNIEMGEPVINILENTLGVNINWANQAEGIYNGISDNISIFSNPEKVFLSVSSTYKGSPLSLDNITYYALEKNYALTNMVGVKLHANIFYEGSFLWADTLKDVCVEIRVYS